MKYYININMPFQPTWSFTVRYAVFDLWSHLVYSGKKQCIPFLWAFTWSWDLKYSSDKLFSSRFTVAQSIRFLNIFVSIISRAYDINSINEEIALKEKVNNLKSFKVSLQTKKFRFKIIKQVVKTWK